MADGSVAAALERGDSRRTATLAGAAPHFAAAVAFAILFWNPFLSLLRDWWSDPEAQHGLLLAPLALALAWKHGLVVNPRPQPVVGAALLVVSVLLRYVGDLGAELFSMRLSILGAAVALVIFAWGVRQCVAWWLPLLLLLLSIPLPAVVLASIAQPLQLKASGLGASLLAWRDVPVLLSGNIIHLPGRSLFVTEACSGLRSIAALLSLGLLIGGFWLRSPWLRVLLVAATVPIAMALNALRIFLTGFLVYYVDPAFGDGMLHYTEGWALFAVALALVGALGCALTYLDAGELKR